MRRRVRVRVKGKGKDGFVWGSLWRCGDGLMCSCFVCMYFYFGIIYQGCI